MLDRLEEIARKHEDLLAQQADPEIAVDPNRSREVAQKLAELEPVVAAYRDYRSTTEELDGAREIVAEADDEEMRQMAEAEVDDLTARLDTLQRQVERRAQVMQAIAEFGQAVSEERDTAGVLRQLLKTAAKNAETIYVATDPDREGEAIGWHIAQLLDPKEERTKRVTFNEITRDAVKNSFDHAGALDTSKIAAQQTRRILDRLVGYQISPLLWN